MKNNFASTRMAFVLIAILLFFIILSAIIPQKGISQDRIVNWQELLGDNFRYIEILKLDEIYTNPLFFIIVGLLGVNLIFGNIKRFKTIYKLEQTLLKARHVGSIIFHFSLLLIIVGVILNYLFKSEVVFALTEGQTAHDSKPMYHREFNGPFYLNTDERFSLKLDSFSLDHKVENDITQSAFITVSDNYNHQTVNANIRTNRPFEFNSLEFHYGLVYGYSPELLVADSGGQQIFRSFVRLSNQLINDKKTYVDFIILPDQKTRVNIEIIDENTEYGLIKYKIKVKSFDSLFYDGIVSGNDTITIVDNHYSLPRIRNWCYINVVESPYLTLIFFGFWSALAGLIIGFIPRII